MIYYYVIIIRVEGCRQIILVLNANMNEQELPDVLFEYPLE